jgi:hypothetical protein
MTLPSCLVAEDACDTDGGAAADGRGIGAVLEPLLAEITAIVWCVSSAFEAASARSIDAVNAMTCGWTVLRA